MIEEIPAEIRRMALWNAAARQLAEGRQPKSVFSDLRKRGVPGEEIADWWPDIESCYRSFRQARRRRLCLLGWCWLTFGLVIPGVLVFCFGLVHAVLIIAAIPSWYGLYLLNHPIDHEPKIGPPVLFGRNL